MATINKIKLPTNTTYDIHDARISGVSTTISDNDQNIVTGDAVYEAINNHLTTQEIEDIVDELIPGESTLPGKENVSNKVTSISSTSTDEQYPSAKAVYDFVNNSELSNVEIDSIWNQAFQDN